MKKITKCLALTCSLLAIGFVSFFNITAEAAVIQNNTKYSARYYKKGDVNMDGKINMEDVQIALDAVNGLIVLTDLETRIADMNNNGVVDRDDVERILKIALKIDSDIVTNNFQ